MIAQTLHKTLFGYHFTFSKIWIESSPQAVAIKPLGFVDLENRITIHWNFLVPTKMFSDFTVFLSFNYKGYNFEILNVHKIIIPTNLHHILFCCGIHLVCKYISILDRHHLLWYLKLIERIVRVEVVSLDVRACVHKLIVKKILLTVYIY